jgi:hypothetical protein
MIIKGPGDREWFATQFSRQQSFLNKAVDFRFGQFDHQAAQPLPSSFPVVTHKLSQDFLRDLQEDWEQHGKGILSIMREKFPEIYFQSLVKLAMIHRVELGQPQAFEQPRTREEVLRKMEERAGPVGRKILEEFLVKLDKLESVRSWANFG